MKTILFLSIVLVNSILHQSKESDNPENEWYYFAIAQSHCGGGDESKETFLYYITEISRLPWCSKSCTANEDAMKTELYNKLIRDEAPYNNCSGPYMKDVTPEIRRKGIRILPFNNYDEAVKTKNEWIVYYKNRSGDLGQVKIIDIAFTKDCSHCRR